MVKLPLYLSDLCLRLLRERSREIPTHHLHPITDQTIKNQIDEIAEKVMDAEWQQRKQIPKGIDERLDRLRDER